MKVLTVFDNRPEAIKMAPLVKQPQSTEGVGNSVTAQHSTGGRSTVYLTCLTFTLITT